MSLQDLVQPYDRLAAVRALQALTDEARAPRCPPRRRTRLLRELRTGLNRLGRSLALGLLLVWLTGCTTTATYTRGPDAVTCVRPAHSPGSGLLGLLTSPLYAQAEYDAATTYAACKSAAERLGFTRQP